MRCAALTGLATLLALVAGCGGENTRPLFLEALKNWVEIQNREAAVAREKGAPLVHEYRDVRFPEATDQGMPPAKRRHLDAKGGDEVVSGAYAAVLSYTLVTLERQVQKVSIPQETVSKDARPDQIATTDQSMPVYMPVRYAAGRQLFVFKGGRLVAHPVPYEIPMTEAEQKKVLLRPIAAAKAEEPAK